MDYKTKLFLSVLLEQQESPERDNAGAYYPELRATTSGVQKVGSVSFRGSKEYIVSILRLDLKLLKDSTTFSANTIFPLYKIASEQESYNNIKTFLNDEKLANSIPAQNKFKEVFTDSGLNLSFSKTKVGDIFDEIGKLYEGEDKNPQEDFEKLRNNFANLLKSINTGNINDSDKIRNAIVTQIQNTILANKEALRSNGPTIRKFNDFISPKFTSSKPGEVKVVTTTDNQEEDQTVVQDPETGNTATILDGTAKFITMLEFLQARKDAEERIFGNSERGTEQYKDIIKHKGETSSFINSVFAKFKSFLSGIFKDNKDLNNKIENKQATKTFLSSAKDRIYNIEDKDQEIKEAIDNWTQKEFSDAVNNFINTYNAYGGIMEKLKSLNNKPELLKKIAEETLNYYSGTKGQDINFGIDFENLKFADSPEQQEELVADMESDTAETTGEQTGLPLKQESVSETINLNNKSQNTSKLIIESITKSKKITTKGTKEQITLFNKLIKEELSIINKIKNNKPYIIPTKDIENFERLTGIVWPFKEGN